MRRPDGLGQPAIVPDHTEVRSHPDMSSPVFEQAVDAVVQQSVFNRVVTDGAAIKTRETATGGDPQDSVAVSEQVIDPLIHQPVFNTIKPDAIFGMPASETSTGGATTCQMEKDLAVTTGNNGADAA